jgi:deoxyribonuclease-4
MCSLRIGIHTSRAGSLEKAAIRAHDLAANTFQIFSASPKMWRALPPHPDDAALFRRARERFDLDPLAVHVNYLINLASLDPLIRSQSILAFRGELERAAIIGAEYLVVHPGNHKSNPAEEGMAGFVLGLAEAAKDLNLSGLTVLIENTVGAGAQLGGKLLELRAMHDLACRVCDVPIAYCLDTCHLLASGFDIRTEAGLKQTLAEIDKTLGLKQVRVIHANDSKGGLGSHVDRHANIGEGHIGTEGFARILQSPALREKPFILETPVDVEGDDRRNLELLKRLAAPAPEVDKKRQKNRKVKSDNAGKGVRFSGNRA